MVSQAAGVECGIENPGRRIASRPALTACFSQPDLFDNVRPEAWGRTGKTEKRSGPSSGPVLSSQVSDWHPPEFGTIKNVWVACICKRLVILNTMLTNGPPGNLDLHSASA